MALTTAEAARLAAFKTAYDKIISGGSVQRVRTAEGAEKAFHPGNANLLKQEIEALETKATSATGRKRGAVRFTIG